MATGRRSASAPDLAREPRGGLLGSSSIRFLRFRDIGRRCHPTWLVSPQVLVPASVAEVRPRPAFASLDGVIGYNGNATADPVACRSRASSPLVSSTSWG